MPGRRRDDAATLRVQLLDPDVGPWHLEDGIVQLLDLSVGSGRRELEALGS